MRDEYLTLAGAGRREIRIRGSRFIAHAEPVASRDAVMRALAAIRREFFDATHHCYAYRLGLDGSDFRAVDGGEPSGTAGKPILAAIDHAGLTEVLIVVTRYFGGTKLGVGGLAHAYGEAAAAVLASVAHTVCYRTIMLRATFAHALVSVVMRVAGNAGAKIGPATYDDAVHLPLTIRASKVDELVSALVEGTRGEIQIRRDD